jgi:hypothetical protein
LLSILHPGGDGRRGIVHVGSKLLELLAHIARVHEDRLGVLDVHRSHRRRFDL